MRPIIRQSWRKNRFGLGLAFIGLLSLGLAGALYKERHALPRFAFVQDKGPFGPDIDILLQLDRAHEQIAQAVTPAVVAIQSTQVIRVEQSPLFADPFFREFFGDLFAQNPRTQREHALGSGVIVSPDGYIVTNNHVVAKATEIQVMLSDKRMFKGITVGADPQTDIAVIKIDSKNLPTAPWCDSSQLRVGDAVMAFGNPFGQYFTVTQGIVSAIGRSGLDSERAGFEDFIQTDAAINPGNSGGALVNMRAQVVGINAAILARNTGGFLGIGFAVPSNMARHVMQDLVRTGSVSRGYIGVGVQTLNDAYSKKFKVPDTAGALIQNVTPGGPADSAGLKAGDVIRRYNRQAVESPDQLTAMVTNTDPGSKATLDILRDGNPKAIEVTIGERPANLAVRAGVGEPLAEGTLRGISVQDLNPLIRENLGIPANVQGVVIKGLDPDSPAAQSGPQAGGVIESINRQPVHNVEDFARSAAKANGRTLLRVNRQGTGAFVVVSPAESGNDQ